MGAPDLPAAKDANQGYAPLVTEYALYEPRPEPTDAVPLLSEDAVRRAIPEDAPGIAALVAQRHGMPLERALDGVRREFAGIAAGNPWTLVVADVDGGVVGFGRTRQVAMREGVPGGWYLMGLIVHRAYRRRGIGEAITRKRLSWIRERSREAYYFANKENRASIDLHAVFGFRLVSDEFEYERASFARGDGSLYRIELR